SHCPPSSLSTSSTLPRRFPAGATANSIPRKGSRQTKCQSAVPDSNWALGQGMPGAAGRCTKILKEFARNFRRGAAQETVLRARFVGNRLRGNEICLKTTRVRIEQLLNSLVAVGLQNET